MSFVDRNVKEPLFPADTFVTYDGGTRSGVLRSLAFNSNRFTSKDNGLWVAARDPAKKAHILKYAGALDMGNGSFFKERTDITEISHPDYTIGPKYPYTYKYSGPWLPGDSDRLRKLILEKIAWPSENDVSLDLFGLGGTAISRTLPTRSHVSLGVTLGELRKEGLPKIVGLSALDKHRGLGQKAGHEYLNVQFGWAPLISDFRKLLIAVRDSSRIIDEYRRKSDTHIRRRYHFPTSTETFDFVNTGTAPLPSLSAIWTGPSTSVRISGTYVSDAWFSGAYRYSVPVGTDVLSSMKQWESEANRLLGLRITPELLWNTTAWSWLLDWFMTIGNMVTNISYIGKDGLVLEYGYIMRSLKVDAHITTLGRPRDSATPASCRLVIDQKARRRASPYGFGINPSSLSAKQWSILGALGLTKAPGKL